MLSLDADHEFRPQHPSSPHFPRPYRAVANLDRRDQHRIRTDLDIIADLGVVFVLAVVIAGDRAGADIGIFADRRVAEIGQMAGFRASSERRFL